MGDLVSGVLNAIGGNQQARAARDAARISANAQLEAARIAAEESRFRPVGITTRFGTSQFQTDPQGRVIGASYNVSPEIAAIRDRLLSQAGEQGVLSADQALQAQQGLFNLGQQYLAQTPEAAAEQFMQRQQAALAPARERALNQVRQGLFNRGRSGLAVAQGEGMGAANPELQAYYNAMAQQDLDLASRAQQEGRAATEFGAGLFGTGARLAAAGYSPLQTQIGLSSTLENLGQDSLDIGSALGGRITSGNQQAARTLLSGGLDAARTMQQVNQYSPVGAALTGLAGNQQLMSGIGSLLSNIGNPFGGTPQGAYGQQDQYLAGALLNPQTQQARMLAEQNSWF